MLRDYVLTKASMDRATLAWKLWDPATHFELERSDICRWSSTRHVKHVTLHTKYQALPLLFFSTLKSWEWPVDEARL